MNKSKDEQLASGGRLLVMGIALIIIFGVVVYLGAIGLDSEADTAKCWSEFSKMAGNVSPSSTFANDDFWVLNMGRKINCTVFWYDRFCLTHTNFESGTLTEAQVASSRYC